MNVDRTKKKLPSSSLFLPWNDSFFFLAERKKNTLWLLSYIRRQRVYLAFFHSTKNVFLYKVKRRRWVFKTRIDAYLSLLESFFEFFNIFYHSIYLYIHVIISFFRFLTWLICETKPRWKVNYLIISYDDHKKQTFVLTKIIQNIFKGNHLPIKLDSTFFVILFVYVFCLFYQVSDLINTHLKLETSIQLLNSWTLNIQLHFNYSTIQCEGVVLLEGVS